jgi:hypothetical protein
METLLKILLGAFGAKPNGSPKTFNVDGVAFLRNLLCLIGLIAGGAVYASRITSTPVRLDILEARMRAMEMTVTRTEEGVRRIDEKLTVVLPFMQRRVR